MSSSVSCQMLYCINKGVSGEWMKSYFPGSQETLQKWQKNDNILKQAHNHYVCISQKMRWIHWSLYTLITPTCKFIGIPSVFGSERKLHEINLSHISVQIHWRIPPTVLNNNYIFRPDSPRQFLAGQTDMREILPRITENDLRVIC